MIEFFWIEEQQLGSTVKFICLLPEKYNDFFLPEGVDMGAIEIFLHMKTGSGVTAT